MIRLMTALLWLASLALVVFILSGCGGGVYQSSGKPAPAPEGWTQLCRDQPTYPGCKPLNTTCSMAQCSTSNPIQCVNTC